MQIIQQTAAEQATANLRSRSPCLSQLPLHQVAGLAFSSPWLGPAWRRVFGGSPWMGFSSPCLRGLEAGSQVLFAYGPLCEEQQLHNKCHLEQG